MKLESGDSEGGLALMELTYPPNLPTPRHMHEHANELFYILEGEVTFLLGDDPEPFKAVSGSMVFIPRNTPHEFTITSPEPARYLFMYTPGGFERYVRASSDPAAELCLPPPAGPLSAERLAELQALGQRYDSRWVPRS